MTLLSVHIITYNNEKYIIETLQSIVNQKTTFEFEVVISDDQSTDNTYDKILEFTKTHPKLFKIQQNENRLGILKNFKSTLDRCSAKYVFDIAGDDYLKTNDALEKMVLVMESDPKIDFIDCGYDKLFENKNKIESFSNESQIDLSTEQYKKEVLLGKVYPIGCCFKKEALYEYVDFETYLNMNLTIEDYPILVDLVYNSNFKTINESLIVYRIHDSSHSNAKNFEQRLFNFDQMKRLFVFFAKKYSFEKNLITLFNNNHYKGLLFIAGYFSNKELGKKAYMKIKTKSLKDRFLYLLSQNKIFRNLISWRKKLLFFK